MGEVIGSIVAVITLLREIVRWLKAREETKRSRNQKAVELAKAFRKATDEKDTSDLEDKFMELGIVEPQRVSDKLQEGRCPRNDSCS